MGLQGTSVEGIREVLTKACKAGACYRRSDGKQGELVVCFRDEEDECTASTPRQYLTPYKCVFKGVVQTYKCVFKGVVCTSGQN